MQNTKFNIIGSGAIGHLWYCYLQKQQCQVQLIARRPIDAKTIRVDSPNVKFSSLVKYQTLEQSHDLDSIIICVKAHQLETLCQSLVNKVTKGSPFILMMNGLGLVEIVNRYFPDSPTIHASITHGAYLHENTLYHTGNGVTELGNLQTSYSKQSFAPIVGMLNAALPEVVWNEHHRETMHLKLIVNAIINPVTALNGIKNGLIVENNNLISEADRLLNELKPLLPTLLPNHSIKQIQQHIISIAQQTSSNISSMQQDVLNNRETEIDFINGYLLTLAKTSSLELSHHSQIISRIKALKQI